MVLFSSFFVFGFPSVWPTRNHTDCGKKQKLMLTGMWWPYALKYNRHFKIFLLSPSAVSHYLIRLTHHF